MNKITRNIGLAIGVAIVFACVCFVIYTVCCGIANVYPESWFVFAVGFGVGGIILFICCPPRIATYIADALRLGGKQMLCDIIKWTIIIIIAAVVFTIAYKIAVSSENT